MKFKTLICLLSISLLSLPYSCIKDQNINPATDIKGNWEWILTNIPATDGGSGVETPENTGNQETILFNTDKWWYKIQNSIRTDSGTYTLGHGSYTPIAGSSKYVYDSIVYYHNGIQIEGGWDYYTRNNDTLQFSPGYAGKNSSYTLPFNGSKTWVRK